MVLQDWSQLAKIDPEFENVLKEASDPIPVLNADIPTLRRILAERKEAQNKAHAPDLTGIIERDITIVARDGYNLPIRIHSPPPNPSVKSPLIIMFHGGGWCLGGLDNELINCRNFVRKFNAVVLNVDYRLAPEHPFPTPVDDSWDAVKWAATHAQELNADPSQGFIIGGTSAGGNIASAISLLARDEKLSPPLTGACLLIPCIIGGAVPEKYKDFVKSYVQNRDAPVLGHGALDLLKASYNPDDNSPLFNVFAPGTSHEDLPPTYFQVCGMDPLRDDALVFEHVLREDLGTKTKLDIYPGVPHSFYNMWPQMNISKKFVNDTTEGVAWLLEQV